MAAFENNVMDYESIVDPWSNVIARSKDYNGIRIPGKKKSKNVYQQLIKKMIDNWEKVTKLCEQAKNFEENLNIAMTHNCSD